MARLRGGVTAIWSTPVEVRDGKRIGLASVLRALDRFLSIPNVGWDPTVL